MTNTKTATGLKLATAICLFVIAQPCASAMAITGVVPHRAVYDLDLKSARKRSGVKDLTGRMVMEITGSACEGWSVNFRIVFDLQLPRGKKRLIDSRSTSWESGDGRTMTYFEREFIDNRPHQVTRLTASLKSLKVTQKLPKKLSFDIPDGAMFPITHQLHLIDTARAGKLRDKSIVYDGSDHENIHQAITFIGKMRTNNKPFALLKGDGGKELLANKRAWPVSVSYFELRGKDQKDTPSQQVSFLMYENGVAGDLVIDYGDFAMKGKLTYLDKLPVSKCTK